MKPLNIQAGDKFNRLTVMYQAPYAGRKKYPSRRWHCQCSCGNECDVLQYNLTAGTTKSCGCWKIEELSNRKTHGMSHGENRTPEYQVWQHIKSRCYGRTKDAHNYQDRGIVVCGGWRNNFLAFLADMGTRPSAKHSIDRIDNDANYSCGHCEECLENEWPMNCQWATWTVQMHNLRKNVWFTINNETLIISDWAKRLGTSAWVLRGRLKRGWSIEEAMTKPLMR